MTLSPKMCLYPLLTLALLAGSGKSHATTIQVKDGALGAAVKALRQDLQSPPSEAITLLLEPGTYSYDDTIVFDSLYSFSQKAPLSITVKDGGKAIFTGGISINMSTASLVTDSSIQSKLGKGSVGKVYSIKASNAQLAQILSKEDVKMSIKGKMMQLSQYPNVGFGHIDKVLEKGVEYAEGRTKGPVPSYTMDKPVGGLFTMFDKDVSRWETEFKEVKKASLSGYLSHDWYREKHKIASITDGKIRLLEHSRYGIIDIQGIPRRLIVSNLMCELDSPGEFYYEDSSETLYFWPCEGTQSQDQLVIWTGKPFVKFDQAANIKMQNIIIEGVAQGPAAVEISNSHNIELAGCTIRNCSRQAVKIEGGTNCGIRSCDIYDVPAHVTISGGNLRQLSPSKNYAINCHFTQTQYGYYGKIALNGVGQIFRNNLIHNFVGQIMTLGDNDHQLVNNEFFNIGIEEGDGGTIYQGAQMWSWGNVIENNFLHHLMCIPKAHPRGGIYPDDKDQGDTIVNNVFYKAAHRAILINGGAGHTVNSNIFLKGHIGIYNTNGDIFSNSAFEMAKKYDAGQLKRGDKMDYVWRTEQAIGEKGWNDPIWKKKYPKFAKIMNQPQKRYWSIECTVKNNRFYGNDYNTQFNTKETPTKNITLPFEKVKYISTGGNKDITLAVFKDPEKLNFSYKNKASANNMPDIHFDRIGLYIDEYRKTMPDKDAYRAKLRNHFKGRKSYDKDAKYNAKTINQDLYFNTGKLILEM